MAGREIIIIGGGGHYHSCIDIIEQTGEFNIAGVVDANPEGRREVWGVPILGDDDDLSRLRERFDSAFIAIGQIDSCAPRVRLYDRLKELGYQLPAIISPHAYVSSHAMVGEGTIVMHQVIVNAGATVGANCILNTKCLIEHDAEIGDHTHISTAAIVNGGVRVGRRCFLGSNATVVHGVTLPDDWFGRSGSLIVRPEDGRMVPHDS